MESVHSSFVRMKAPAKFASLGEHGTALSQTSRLITLITPQEREVPEVLVAKQFIGRKAINEQDHVGNHCFHGLPANQTRYDSPSYVTRSKCVMYGSANGVIDFCVNCAPAVCKADLSDGWRPL